MAVVGSDGSIQSIDRLIVWIVDSPTFGRVRNQCDRGKVAS